MHPYGLRFIISLMPRGLSYNCISFTMTASALAGRHAARRPIVRTSLHEQSLCLSSPPASRLLLHFGLYTCATFVSTASTSTKALTQSGESAS